MRKLKQNRIGKR